MATQQPLSSWSAHLSEFDLAPRAATIDGIPAAQAAFGLASDQLQRLREASYSGFTGLDQVVDQLNGFTDNLQTGLTGLQAKLESDIKTGILKGDNADMDLQTKLDTLQMDIKKEVYAECLGGDRATTKSYMC